LPVTVQAGCTNLKIPLPIKSAKMIFL